MTNQLTEQANSGDPEINAIDALDRALDDAKYIVGTVREMVILADDAGTDLSDLTDLRGALGVVQDFICTAQKHADVLNKLRYARHLQSSS